MLTKETTTEIGDRTGDLPVTRQLPYPLHQSRPDDDYDDVITGKVQSTVELQLIQRHN